MAAAAQVAAVGSALSQKAFTRRLVASTRRQSYIRHSFGETQTPGELDETT